MIGLDVGCVHDQEVVVVAAAVDDQVVHDSPAFVREERVLRVAGSDPIEIVGEPRLQVLTGAVAGDSKLAHVRDVEDSCAF